MKRTAVGKTAFCLALSMLFVSAIALLPVGAEGPESTSKEHFEFEQNRAGSKLETEPVEKGTSSYVYMHCTYFKDCSNGSILYAGQYTAYVMGAASDNKYFADCSRGHVYTFRQGTEAYMLNWVHEDHLEYAKIRASYSGGSYPFEADGDWLADCDRY